MRAEIIAVGSELLTPDRVDTNSLFLTAQLNRLGIEVVRKTIVGDDLEGLSREFRAALELAEVTVACGGLGPTEDDITREALAAVLRRPLVQNEEVLKDLQAKFERFGRTMPQINVKQAMVPVGATVLSNPRGTAPGLWIEDGPRIVILVPGPPGELEPMFIERVVPRLEVRVTGARLVARELRVTGLGESAVDQAIAPIYKGYGDVQTTLLHVPGEIHVHLRLWSADAPAAEKRLDELVERIRRALGESLFTTKGEEIEQVVAQQLTWHGATLAVAESCTGGMLGERLTRIPGSSAYFVGGVVSYGNELKSGWLDVPRELIDAKGAVSAEAARAMAEGVRKRAGTTLGLSITGIAGPTGGTAEKPVGTVHIALADAQGAREKAFKFPGDRGRIRGQATVAALDMVRRYYLSAGDRKPQ
ncbi:MAG TPA: competence/damage-inducible protein A [Candidatus Acidoferrales bacterium]|nr:competence/damage-inducible protein A [Candidatus Acidoferrales bacterium]